MFLFLLSPWLDVCHRVQQRPWLKLLYWRSAGSVFYVQSSIFTVPGFYPMLVLCEIAGNLVLTTELKT